MDYTAYEVEQYIRETDVKFIRLAFCDVFGRRKNIAIMPDELQRAFTAGIAFDASAVDGFGCAVHSDLLLHPDPATLTSLPWRPDSGRVVQMFCDITYPDGRPFECDTRALLKRTVAEAQAADCRFFFGSELEFYLFKIDENGDATQTPLDRAGYMDVAPDDRGENVRREICLNLEKMGVFPESSHHEQGPGQNEVDFRYSDPLTAADGAVMFKTVVKTAAARNGLAANFSPKPLAGEPGSGFHINMSCSCRRTADPMSCLIAGTMAYAREISLFLNPTEGSYDRLGGNKAPGYVSWSHENRSQLVRVPAAEGQYRRIELRSSDCGANPYVAFSLLMRAGMSGIFNALPLAPACDLDLYSASPEQLAALERLPRSLKEATQLALDSEFVRSSLPEQLIDAYANRG